MARNKISDLRNHMFAALERLEDEDISAEQLEMEVKRSKAVKNIADGIIDTARVEIEFLKSRPNFNNDGSDFLNDSLTKGLNE